jgi:hypothetical protein
MRLAVGLIIREEEEMISGIGGGIRGRVYFGVPRAELSALCSQFEHFKKQTAISKEQGAPCAEIRRISRAYVVLGK